MSAVVVFDSKHGSTADVAGMIAGRLGENVRLVYLRDRGASRVSLEDCELVVLGAPVYAGRWSPRAVAFAREREEELSRMNFAYFVVGADPKEGIEVARAGLPSRLADQAISRGQIAGEFRPESLNFFERFILWLVTSASKVSTPTLDRAAVDAFADGLADHSRRTG